MSTVIRGNGWNPGIIKEKIYFAVEILEGYSKDNYKKKKMKLFNKRVLGATDHVLAETNHNKNVQECQNMHHVVT